MVPVRRLVSRCSPLTANSHLPLWLWGSEPHSVHRLSLSLRRSLWRLWICRRVLLSVSCRGLYSVWCSPSLWRTTGGSSSSAHSSTLRGGIAVLRDASSQSSFSACCVVCDGESASPQCTSIAMESLVVLVRSSSVRWARRSRWPSCSVTRQ